jgi:hypothetical protein
VRETDADSSEAARHKTLRRVQQSVLGTLAVCALVIAFAADAGDLGNTDRRFTLGALALGMGSILARRQALVSTERGLRVWLAGASLLLAEAVGLLGLALALMQNERDAGLLYVLGGALLALRAPATAAARGHTPARS